MPEEPEHEPRVNDPQVLAEVEAAFMRYERALMSNDVGTLDALFWSSPHAVRYGVGENLYGDAEIAAFRLARPGGSPQRTVLRRVVTSFARDFATHQHRIPAHPGAAACRKDLLDARARAGYGWRRGWRIVAAHVSLLGKGS